jgi:hypothetical protein
LNNELAIAELLEPLTAGGFGAAGFGAAGFDVTLVAGSGGATVLFGLTIATSAVIFAWLGAVGFAVTGVDVGELIGTGVVSTLSWGDAAVDELALDALDGLSASEE